jgi:hypothetical protein
MAYLSQCILIYIHQVFEHKYASTIAVHFQASYQKKADMVFHQAYWGHHELMGMGLILYLLQILNFAGYRDDFIPIKLPLVVTSE